MFRWAWFQLENVFHFLYIIKARLEYQKRRLTKSLLIRTFTSDVAFSSSGSPFGWFFLSSYLSIRLFALCFAITVAWGNTLGSWHFIRCICACGSYWWRFRFIQRILPRLLKNGIWSWWKFTFLAWLLWWRLVYEPICARLWLELCATQKILHST